MNVLVGVIGLIVLVMCVAIVAFAYAFTIGASNSTRGRREMERKRLKQAGKTPEQIKEHAKMLGLRKGGLEAK